MVKSVLYLIAVYFIGSLVINGIEDLLKLDDPEMRKAIEKFGKEVQECINNKVSETSKENLVI